MIVVLEKSPLVRLARRRAAAIEARGISLANRTCTPQPPQVPEWRLHVHHAWPMRFAKCPRIP